MLLKTFGSSRLTCFGQRVKDPAPFSPGMSAFCTTKCFYLYPSLVHVFKKGSVLTSFDWSKNVTFNGPRQILMYGGNLSFSVEGDQEHLLVGPLFWGGGDPRSRHGFVGLKSYHLKKSNMLTTVCPFEAMMLNLGDSNVIVSRFKGVAVDRCGRYLIFVYLHVTWKIIRLVSLFVGLFFMSFKMMKNVSFFEQNTPWQPMIPGQDIPIWYNAVRGVMRDAVREAQFGPHLHKLMFQPFDVQKKMGWKDSKEGCLLYNKFSLLNIQPLLLLFKE